MSVVLVVEPQLFSTQALSKQCGHARIVLHIATPARALSILQAVMVDTVVIRVDKIEDVDYPMLLSAMRLIAPASTLICLPCG